MAKRRQCLQALAGKSYGSKRKTLRTAYVSYIRAIFGYGAAVYHSHAAPASRHLLEIEQHKCAIAITGCMRLTNSKALLSEAGLPSLTTRAKQLTATEVSRFKRLPEDDPTRRLFENAPEPKLAYRGREAWLRARADAERNGTPEPEPPDRDVAALTHKPCTRRVGEWMLREAGIADAPYEQPVIYPPDPPWARLPNRPTSGLTSRSRQGARNHRPSGGSRPSGLSPPSLLPMSPSGPTGPVKGVTRPEAAARSSSSTANSAR